MPYQWEGTHILRRNTAFLNKRFVPGQPTKGILTDLREWILSEDRAEISRVIKGIGLPETKGQGDFDRRAYLVWQWVLENIEYVEDKAAHAGAAGITDFYQFPAETIALRTGDCEDSAFLLASMLLASGISPFCVRAVLGFVKVNDHQPRVSHAWVNYKDEDGIWRVLESTLPLTELPDPGDWPCADRAARPGSRPFYVPDICLNHAHVWQIRGAPFEDLQEYIAKTRLREG